MWLFVLCPGVTATGPCLIGGREIGRSVFYRSADRQLSMLRPIKNIG